jgi:signal transduction histidine kinase
MTSLDGYFLLVVGDGPAPASRAAALRRAGATVQLCSPELDLWASLGECAFDALLLFVEEGRSPAAVIASLDEDPRTRTIPVLALVELAAAADFLRSVVPKRAVVLPSDLPDQALAEAVGATAAPARSLRELEAQHHSLCEQLQNLRTRSDDARASFQDLAHDLRSLLGLAFGFACNLRDEVVGPINAGQREQVGRILEASRDAAGLLETVRDSERMLRALPVPEMKPESRRPPRNQRTLVDLAALAVSVAGLFEHPAEKQSTTIVCRCEPVTVWGDSLKLKQVLANLVGNALKYAPPGGEIVLTVRHDQPSEASGLPARRRAEIVVRDNGAGIEPEFRERIFERGFRLEQHAHFPGKGRGLSIVREVIAQHGGTVKVDGAPGSGAVFLISLPCDLRVRQGDTSGET